MKKLSFVVSLTNDENDYQQEQAAAAEKAGRRLGVDVKIIHASNDSLKQSQQLLEFIQNTTGPRPDALIFEPAGGTAFPQVARAAAAAGMGWVILNHEVDYVHQLRQAYSVPVFSITSDHVEVGRIQGKQFAALLPEGGPILYIEGPAASSAAKDRTRGMNATKPSNIEVKSMRANWTEESSHRAVSSWLRLRTSRESRIDLVAAQDDSMAMGARRAFADLAQGERERWLKMPFTGCDGMPQTGQAWVRSGELAATIFIRANTDLALEMLTDAIRKGTKLPEQHLTIPESVPALAELAPRAAQPSTGKLQRPAHA